MPMIWTYVGAAIVIASALYIAHREPSSRRAQGAALAIRRKSGRQKSAARNQAKEEACP